MSRPRRCATVNKARVSDAVPVPERAACDKASRVVPRIIKSRPCRNTETGFLYLFKMGNREEQNRC